MGNPCYEHTIVVHDKAVAFKSSLFILYMWTTISTSTYIAGSIHWCISSQQNLNYFYVPFPCSHMKCSLPILKNNKLYLMELCELLIIELQLDTWQWDIFCYYFISYVYTHKRYVLLFIECDLQCQLHQHQHFHPKVSWQFLFVPL